MRLFVAVDVTEAIASAIETAQDHLRRAGADVGWVKSDNLHLTLKFLGETPEARVGDIRAVLDLVGPNHAPFEMKIYDLGCFPDRGNPRVIWAGVTAGREQLAALARGVDESLGELGFPRETRPFVAHLTVGRVRKPRGADRLRRLMEEQSGGDFGQCCVEEVRLYRSTLAPGGSIYELMHRAKLGGK